MLCSMRLVESCWHNPLVSIWSSPWLTHRNGIEPFASTMEWLLPQWLYTPFSSTQRLLGLSMEDPTPPLDTPEGSWGLKTRKVEGPKSIGSLWVRELCTYNSVKGWPWARPNLHRFVFQNRIRCLNLRMLGFFLQPMRGSKIHLGVSFFESAPCLWVERRTNRKSVAPFWRSDSYRGTRALKAGPGGSAWG